MNAAETATLTSTPSGPWPLVRLGEVLAHRKEFIRIDDTVEYLRCRVQLHAKGIVLRDRVEGALIKTKDQQVCRAGEFLVAEIDAKMGGFGVVPPDLAGSIVSSHYFLFVVDSRRLDQRFLDYFNKTPLFRDQVRAQGSTNYAAIRPSHVLDYTMPLPPLPEQRRIVARLDQVAAVLEQSRALAKGARVSANALGGAIRDAVLRRFTKTVSLGDVATVIDPNPSHRYPTYVPSGVPIVSTVNFQGDDEISTAGAPFVTRGFLQETLGRFAVGEGDLVFSRKGKVGYARLLPGGLECAMTHTLCVIQPDRQRLQPRFLLHYARSPLFLSFLTGTMNPNVGVPTLGLNVIRAAPLPVPSLETQDRICRQLDAILAELGNLGTLHARRAAELDAVMPAILDRAFKAEL